MQQDGKMQLFKNVLLMQNTANSTNLQIQVFLMLVGLIHWPNHFQGACRCMQLKVPADACMHPASSTLYSFGLRSSSSHSQLGSEIFVLALLFPAAGKLKSLAGSCAILTDGTIACIEDSFMNYPLTAPPVGLSGVKSLSFSTWHACAIRTDESLVCWGTAIRGSLRPTPSGFNKVLAVDTNHGTVYTEYGDKSGYEPWTCALAMSRDVKCWGNYGGDGQNPSPFELLLASDVVTLGTSSYPGRHPCFVKSDKIVDCGYGYKSSWGNVTKVCMSERYIVALRGDGTMACNDLFSEASGAFRCTSGVTSETNVAELCCGLYYICIRRRDGTVACWGSYTNWTQNVLQVPSGLNDARSLHCDKSNPCVIRANGAVACWGYRGWAEKANSFFNSL